MSYRQSYFALGDYHPWRLLERLLNPYRPMAVSNIRGRSLVILATRRAQRELAQRTAPLCIEMQLYFSCVVKKRVLFHDDARCEVPVSGQLAVSFRPVEALSCDPLEFATHYPERRELRSTAATRMHPSQLSIDWCHGKWIGNFDIQTPRQ